MINLTFKIKISAEIVVYSLLEQMSHSSIFGVNILTFFYETLASLEIWATVIVLLNNYWDISATFDSPSLAFYQIW